jgi:NHLM bacteriocin system ABC transporter ATP-binding protein
MTDRLHEIFELHGMAMETTANSPLPLVDPGAVWLVTRGHVDIVAMTIVMEGEASDLQRTHLLRVPEGQLLFGFRAPPEGYSVLLLGFGGPDSQVIRLPVSQLAEAAREPEIGADVAGLVDEWVGEVCDLCSADLAPIGAHNLRADEAHGLRLGQSAQPQSGVLWIEVEDGPVRFMGNEAAQPIDGGRLFPVGKEAWITAVGQCTVRPQRGAPHVGEERFWQGLEAFHNTVEQVIDLQRTRDRHAFQRRLIAKSEATRSNLAAAFSKLGSVLQRQRTITVGGEEGALLAACRLVGHHMGIEIREPAAPAAGERRDNPLEEIAKESRFALRRVRLVDDWYRRDGGPMLGFLEGGDVPVALLPVSARRYEVHDPAAGTVTPLSASVAAGIEPIAFMFYRCLPDRPLRSIDLVRFAARGIGRDLAMLMLIGAAGGLLTLATPLAIGFAFDSVIPGAERQQMLQIMLGLIVAAFAASAFNFTRNVALIRVQHRSGTALQAAIWDRMVNLPVRFFGDYSAGDLGLRAMGIDRIMSQLSTSVMTSMVTSIFSVFSVALLFYYSPLAALVALGLVAVVLAVTVTCGIFQVRLQRQIQDRYGSLASLVLQLINGVAKIRVAAAEDRAFSKWAGQFAEFRRIVLRSRIVGNNLAVFNSVFPLVAYMTIFLLVADRASAVNMSTGAFLGFIAAFSSLLFGMMRLGSTTVSMLNIAPIYGRLKPILEAAPEVEGGKADPGPLRGRIEVTNLSFRYEQDGPLILDNVSFAADPGEFVALVGPSGSGKSTLLRLLLGFEQPESGSIAYDGFDLSGLDPQRLRRQLGVVLQDGSLLPGDIFNNIVGSAVDLTINDAWEAARLAGLENDVKQMPMGMHTVLAEGASTLSGGQRQRLMIARALVTKPRIVFFDEATSALDNPTQRIVTESLDGLRATRIVIAHRLSTIVNADRIYVLEKGRVVQRGTYEELVGKPGLFYELVKRQIA